MKFPMVFVRHQYEKVTHEYAGLVKTLAGFLEFVQDHCTEFDDDLFRGQKKDWPLLPKLARLRLRGELTVRQAEAEMLRSLKTRALPYLDTVPDNDWDWLASSALWSGYTTA